VATSAELLLRNPAFFRDRAIRVFPLTSADGCRTATVLNTHIAGTASIEEQG
jgi:hypothetical protein